MDMKVSVTDKTVALIEVAREANKYRDLHGRGDAIREGRVAAVVEITERSGTYVGTCCLLEGKQQCVNLWEVVDGLPAVTDVSIAGVIDLTTSSSRQDVLQKVHEYNQAASATKWSRLIVPVWVRE